MAGTATKKAVARPKGRAATNGHDAAASSAAATASLNANGNGLCRTTAVLPVALNANWHLYALKTGTQKNEVLVEALRAYLKARDFEPDRMPKFDVSWHD